MLALAMRLLIMCSNPENAPPQMKSMFVVSTWMKSPRGFFRPPSLGTFTMAPCPCPRVQHGAAGSRPVHVTDTEHDLRDISPASTAPLGESPIQAHTRHAPPGTIRPLLPQTPVAAVSHYPRIGNEGVSVTSRILSRACWTPSPLTSRVMLTFSVFLEIWAPHTRQRASASGNKPPENDDGGYNRWAGCANNLLRSLLHPLHSRARSHPIDNCGWVWQTAPPRSPQHNATPSP